MKAITLKALNHIQDKYKTPKDIRADKEIEAAAIEAAPWTVWIDPAYELPSETGMVLAIVSGHMGNILLEHAFVTASYWKDEGWMLEEIPGEDEEFTVEWWTPIPEAPEEIDNA